MDRRTVVLSGGGAKAAAHVGAMRALREAGIAPARYVATSMGAAIAAALASGVEPAALLDRMVAVGARGLVRSRLAVLGGLYLPSLLRQDALRGALAELVPARAFGELAVPLTVTATDLDSGALLTFGAGGEDAPLLDVLVASCALPLFYPPVELGGRRLGDGGLRAVLPLVPAAALGDEPLVAVDTGPGFDDAAAAPSALPAMVRAHNDAMGILMAAATERELALWRATAGRPPLTYVRPRVERHATFQVDRIRAYAEEGYRATRAALGAPPGTSRGGPP